MTKKKQSVPTRSEVPVHLTWDLTLIYKTDAEWRADYEKVRALIPHLAAFKGRIRYSGRILLAALEKQAEIGKIFGKLNVYTHLHLSVESSHPEYQSQAGLLDDLSNKYAEATSWMKPQFAAIKPERMEAFIAKTPGLELYRQYIDNSMRSRVHVLSADIEKAVTVLGQASGSPQEIYEQFSVAVKFPPAQDSKGEEHAVTHGSYGRLIESQDRTLRENAFRSEFGVYHENRDLVATMYRGQVKENAASAKLRGYKGSLAAALHAYNIPSPVYGSLIHSVHNGLPSLHRFLSLKKRVLGVDKLQFWDLYTSLCGDVDLDLSYEKANEEILKAVAVLGNDYVDTLRDGIASRWVDVMENKGKKAGAFSWGAYGTPPYVLLNWNGSLRSAFTSAHEYGHSMHSYYTRTTQPYPYANYTIFVAEVASTVNEALFAHHLLETNKDPAIKRFIINRQLEDFRATLFRQTMFAEFEKLVHEHYEGGYPLTTDSICRIYYELNQKYYGAVVTLDPLLEIEWARIPHFYNSFYVYQYSTGIAAATTLADQILKEGAPAVKRYRRFLASGSSKYSIDLLRDAGVDLSTPEPVEHAIRVFESRVSQLEKLF